MSFPDSFSRAALAVGLLLLVPTAAHPHAMLHEIVAGEAVIVRLSFAGHDQPLFEPYEVFAPGGETPFQAGRVNALGEVSFRPDRPGTWRLRVFTADGHGTELEFEVDAAGAVTASGGGHDHAHDYRFRVLAALGYLLGVFGLFALWRVRRAPAGPA
jgi:nickel transport protein